MKKLEKTEASGFKLIWILQITVMTNWFGCQIE